MEKRAKPGPAVAAGHVHAFTLLLQSSKTSEAQRKRAMAILAAIGESGAEPAVAQAAKDLAAK